MSAETINRCALDFEFLGRITASIAKEVWANPTFGDTEWGARVKRYGPQQLQSYYIWPLAIDNEDAYEYAVNSNNPHPGLDPGVISDENISAGIQTHWPDDSTVPPPPTAP